MWKCGFQDAPAAASDGDDQQGKPAIAAYKRVVVVSLVLFGLVSLVAAIVTDLHDRSLPQTLGARSSVPLDLSGSSMSDADVFEALGRLRDELRLGLVKVAPDLAGDQSGQVFVALGSGHHLPDVAPRFGGECDAQVEDRSVLVYSFATGTYLVTGESADLAAVRGWVGEHLVESRWADDGVGSTLMLVIREATFATSLLAAVAMMVSLVLSWLSVRARGHALRVLAGVSGWRIQLEDLGGSSLR